MDLGLKGKTTIVTGASGVIGRGLVQRFAEEGSNVVLATRDGKKGSEIAALFHGKTGDAVCIPTDVTDPASVQAMVDETRRRYGQIDVLVNNAGGCEIPGPWVEKSLEDAVWEVNLNIWGVYHCTKAVSEEMLARQSGSIVNITSNSGLLGEAANLVAHYGGTKGYVASLSKGLAYEWGPKRVRVNCIAPGWIIPRRLDDVGEGSNWKKYAADFFGPPEEMQQKAEDGTLFNISSLPIKRVGRPEEIGHLAVFLASDCAAYITGQQISVSGGAYMP
jgi:NAD(P)-dependent dehydrogenase (short-subunit alcohol dehydrogenase family)